MVKRFAKVASHLYILISGKNATHKKKIVKWTPECHQGFEELKKLCTSTPILAFADFTKQFELYTDANVISLGTILYQKQQGIKKVIGYASCALS